MLIHRPSAAIQTPNPPKRGRGHSNLGQRGHSYLGLTANQQMLANSDISNYDYRGKLDKFFPNPGPWRPASPGRPATGGQNCAMVDVRQEALGPVSIRPVIQFTARRMIKERRPFVIFT